MAGDNVYKIVELVGSSSNTIEEAIEGALQRSNETLRNMDWFEVREVRGFIENGGVGWYQVKLGIGFRVDEPGEVNRE